MLSLDFLITSLIVVLIPGSGVILTISTALVAGKRASLFTAIGCTAGIVPHLLASVLGLSAILHTSALAFQGLAFQGLKHAGVASSCTWPTPPGATARPSPWTPALLPPAPAAWCSRPAC
ncbi:translocator protein, LysE family [Pseudomonas chlororaphis subsp. aurantiaca]|nr:translocator protein, LysE family [Pseudomonas chlororaphis subsp. aurantiaca]